MLRIASTVDIYNKTGLPLLLAASDNGKLTSLKQDSTFEALPIDSSLTNMESLVNVEQKGKSKYKNDHAVQMKQYIVVGLVEVLFLYPFFPHFVFHDRS